MLTKLTSNELEMIKGEQIGLADMLEEPELGFYSREYYESGQAEPDNSSDEMTSIDHKSSIFMFMMAKDDNLLL